TVAAGAAGAAGAAAPVVSAGFAATVRCAAGARRVLDLAGGAADTAAAGDRSFAGGRGAVALAALVGPGVGLSAPRAVRGPGPVRPHQGEQTSGGGAGEGTHHGAARALLGHGNGQAVEGAVIHVETPRAQPNGLGCEPWAHATTGRP